MDWAKPGTILAGKYRVQRLLGTGGMGAVVAARELTSERIVAVKCLLPARMPSTNAYERFIREARILSMLHSESLAAVFDSGVLDNGIPYFVMEYIDGLDLSAVITKHAPLAITDAVDLLSQVSRCIADVHSHGLVHRDLKPENIRLTIRANRSVLIKVIDFGLSKILSEELAKHLSHDQPLSVGIMGTPAYMPPEQARSPTLVDQRSDIWSMGAILYHMLSGQTPFQAQSPAEALAKLVVTPPTPLHAVAPWVPETLQAVVMRCLEKEPSRRFQTTLELGLALDPFTSASPRGPARVFPRGKPARGPQPLDLAALVEQHQATLVDDDDEAEELSLTDDAVSIIDIGSFASSSEQPSQGADHQSTWLDRILRQEPPEGIVALATTMYPQPGYANTREVEEAISRIPACIHDLHDASAAGSAVAMALACARLCERARALGAVHLAHLGQTVGELANSGMLDLCGTFIGEIEQEFQSVLQTLMARAGRSS